MSAWRPFRWHKKFGFVRTTHDFLFGDTLFWGKQNCACSMVVPTLKTKLNAATCFPWVATAPPTPTYSCSAPAPAPAPAPASCLLPPVSCLLSLTHSLTCLLAYLLTCLLAYLLTCLLAYLLTCLLAYLLASLLTCLLPCLLACLLA
jgi:hypothetical protein